MSAFTLYIYVCVVRTHIFYFEIKDLTTSVAHQTDEACKYRIIYIKSQMHLKHYCSMRLQYNIYKYGASVVCAFSPRLIGQRRLFLASGFPEGCILLLLVAAVLVFFSLYTGCCGWCTPCVCGVCMCMYNVYIYIYTWNLLFVYNSRRKTKLYTTIQYDSIVFAVRKRDEREVRQSIIYSDFFWLKKKLFLGAPPKGLTSKRFRLFSCACSIYIYKILYKNIIRIRIEMHFLVFNITV